MDWMCLLNQVEHCLDQEDKKELMIPAFCNTLQEEGYILQSRVLAMERVRHDGRVESLLRSIQHVLVREREEEGAAVVMV
jgi:hypothetical protein